MKKLIILFFAALFAMVLVADNSTITLSFNGPSTSTTYHWSKANPLTIVVPSGVKKLAFSGIPSGLKYDSKTSQLIGTPKKPGYYTVTAKLTDYYKRTVKYPFRLRVCHFTDADNLFQVRAENTNYESFVTISRYRDREERDKESTFQPFVGVDKSYYIPRKFKVNSANTLKISGLPRGLKFIADKSNPGTYEITGAISKAGNYLVTATVTTPEKKKFVSTFNILAQALPNWAVGTFNGIVHIRSGSEGYLQMSATVSANGKVSAKMYDRTGTLRKFSGYLSRSDGINESSTNFYIAWEDSHWYTQDKNGKYYDLKFWVFQRGKTGVGVINGTYVEQYPYVSVEFALDQNPWTAKKKISTPVFAKGLVYQIMLENNKGYIVHKFGSKGKVSVKYYAYKGAKKSTSCSATLSAYWDGNLFRGKIPYFIKGSDGMNYAYWWGFRIYGPLNLDNAPVNPIAAKKNWGMSPYLQTYW